MYILNGTELEIVNSDFVERFCVVRKDDAKLAVEYNAFLRKLESEGRTKYNYGELIDEVILPITNL